MKEIKIGILGAGFMAKMHLESYKLIDGAKVSCVYKQTADEEFAKKYGVKLYTDIDKMLDENEFDVIDICLPSFMHVNSALKAMDKCRYLFLEKPVALTDIECDKLLAKQKQSGCKVQVGHVLRFEQEYLYLKNAIQNNTFGKVSNATFRRLSPSPGWGKGWQCDISKSGGALVDLFIHDADMMLWLFGNPCKSQSITNSIGEKLSYVSVLCKYPEFVVSLEGSWQFPTTFPFSAYFRVVFENAVVEYKDGSLTVYDSKSSYKPELPKKVQASVDVGGNISDLGGYYNELEYFINAVKNKEDITKCTLIDGANALKYVLNLKNN